MQIPHHIAIIPDGNRRWAKKRGIVKHKGHAEGAKTVEKILKAALELRIPYVTLWIASVGNITERTPLERRTLFALFERFFDTLARDKEIAENGVRVSVIGRSRELCPASLVRAIEKAEESTARYKKCRLTILLAYSGVDEMTDAVAKIANEVSARGKIKVNEETIKSHLWTHDLPSVDLVIRTGGESHWSQGFMMWDVAEAQLYFTETLWPDFSREEFLRAVKNYAKTDRRYGK